EKSLIQIKKEVPENKRTRIGSVMLVSRAWVADYTPRAPSRRYNGRNTIVPVRGNGRKPKVPLVKQKTAVWLDRFGNQIGIIEREK
ncbi:MAG: hypothetical protein D6706_18410, partial [Chloroflexi bacterium]